MTNVEKAKHDAAIKLQRFVNERIKDKMAGWPNSIAINDPEALAVIDAISVHVIATIEHYLQDLRRVGNGD